MQSLDAIGLKHGTDKASTVHNYLGFYDRILSPFRDRPFVMLEMGVKEGASVKMWQEYFTQAVVVGMDIDGGTKQFESERIKVRIGDSSRLESLLAITAEFGPPLVVIDDASHRWHHQIETFRYLFPILQRGGLFIIEDLHTSFPIHEADYGYASNISAYDYLLKLNRRLVAEERKYLGEERVDDGFIANYVADVETIEFARSACAIRKLA